MKTNDRPKFSEFLKWLIKHLGRKRCFPTLGERSCFSATFASSELVLINSRKNKRTFGLVDLEEIFNRFKKLTGENQRKGCQYNHPSWPQSPDRVFAPYVPRLISEFLKDEN